MMRRVEVVMQIAAQSGSHPRSIRRERALWLVLSILAAPGCSTDESSDAPADAAVDADADVNAERSDPTKLTVPTNAALRSVWGTADDDLWVVGELGTIIHYDGSSLSLIESGTQATLMAVHGTGPDDVWFVGDQGATLHWDGSSISTHVAPSDDILFSLLSVWAKSEDDVWAVGILPTQTERVGLVRHWDGDGWEQLQVPESVSLWEIWGSGPNSEELWIVGTNQAIGGYVLRATGPLLESVAFEGGPLRGVWGSADDDIWVMPYDSPAQHWDGSEWSSAGVMPDQAMLATGGNGARDVWAVGLGGTILHYDGDEWTPFESPTTENLWSVWGSGKHRAWAAGGAGALLHWDGEDWTQLTNVLPDP
jgi:hypothetical protein